MVCNLQDGRQINCEVAGPFIGPVGHALLLIHGFPLDSRVWREVAAITSWNWRTIWPDLPGFGGSDGEPLTIESLAHAMHEVLGLFRTGPVVVAGLSMGGYVALEMVRQFPADVEGLALVDTRADADDEAGRRRRDEMIELARTSGSGAVVDQLHPALLAPSTLTEAPQVAQRLRQIMQRAVGVRTIKFASAAMRDRRDSMDLLPQLRVPVSVIVGAQDRPTPPEVARQMAAAIPDAELTIIPDAGHMTPLEKPAEVAAALERLMRRVSAIAR